MNATPCNLPLDGGRFCVRPLNHSGECSEYRSPHPLGAREPKDAKQRRQTFHDQMRARGLRWDD